MNEIEKFEMAEKIAVVTGSNKGIGYAIVKGLCERFQGKVYLTARDVTRGKEAVKKLNDSGFQPLFHQLDINDQNSIDHFKDHIVKEHGGIDILVNNAAIAFKHDAQESFSQQAKETIDVNYFSLLRCCNSLFPILRHNARVVNISSSCGHLSRIPSEGLRKKLGDKTITIEELSKLMKKFVSDAETGKHAEEGWGNNSYIVSKVGCSALSFIQQRIFDSEKPCRNISVNAVHPGYVDTDMTSHKGHLTIEEGATAPLYLALEDHGLKEKYIWHDTKVVDWYGETPAIY